jgi:hypothetical protein
MLRQQVHRRIDRDAKMRGDLLHVCVSEHSLKLLPGDRQIVAAADPRLHMLLKAALPELGNNAVEA